MTAETVSEPQSSPTAALADPSAFTVRFWGVRGSIAAPGPETVRYGGNTPCVEVRCGDARLVFDAGTGIRPLGDALKRLGAVDLDLMLTHTHLDHIAGLPFFAPLFDQDSRVRLWAGHLSAGLTLRSVLKGMMSAPLFPVPVEIFCADCSYRDFTGGETLRPKPGVTVRTGRLNHPDGAVGYRVEFAGRSLCYITDTEQPETGRDPAVVELARGADLMIYDSTYSDAEYPSRRGWGHSTWQECLRVADAAGVGRAVIFHHEPSRSDADLDAIAAAAEALRPGTLVAREGLEIAL